MRKWIMPALACVLLIALGLLIWQLDLPNWKKLDLEKIRAIPESTIVYDENGAAIGPLHAARERRYASLSEIPEHTIAAFLTAEDQRFYQHSGVDVRRIFGALLHDLKTMSLAQGASTITQQLIKLTHLSSEKTLSRKAQEAVLARKLERRMSKDEILEAYLNIIYFGEGAYGVGTAAQLYFGKDVSELTISESALLAGIIKSPDEYNPRLKSANALKRRDLILAAMQENDSITAAEYESARSARLYLVSEAEGKSGYSWYMDLVMQEAQDALDMDAEEIISAGLHIYTGYNAEFQETANALFENGANFPDPASDGTAVQAAFIAMRPETGEIAAIVGGREYEVRRGFNRATQMLRQPGSAIKPISTYAAAIEEKGFLPTSTVEDVQREFPGKYLPGNAGGNYYGTVTLREALSRSLNVATVDLADLIGMQTVRSTIAAFGIPLAAQDVNLSLSLGAMTNGVSPARLCAAYCALANGGMRTEAHAVRRITDMQGKLLYEAKQPNEQAVSAETAFLVDSMLQTAATTGSAKALKSAGMPIMGKTGTVGESTGGNRDIWTVAATPDLAVAVWMGFDEPDSAHSIPDWAGGSSYPAQLCATFFKENVQNLSGADFTAPDTLIPVQIDRAALESEQKILLAASNTPEAYLQLEWFPSNRVPTQTSELWSAPEGIDDLTLLNGSGETPTLAFTCRSATADYLVLRKHENESEIAAVLSGSNGDLILWADTQADPEISYVYSILPRHRLLYESGVLLTGEESNTVSSTPGNLLNRLFGT